MSIRFSNANTATGDNEGRALPFRQSPQRQFGHRKTADEAFGRHPRAADAVEADRAAAAPPQNPHQTGADQVQDCPDVRVFNIGGVSVRNMTCRQAERVITGLPETVTDSFAADGFDCVLVGSSGTDPAGHITGGHWRCTEGDRAFRFSA